MTIEDKILSLIKMKNPDDPVKYTQNIIKSYSLDKVTNNIKNCSDCGLCNSGVRSIPFGKPNSSILVVVDGISKEQFDSGKSLTLPLVDSDGETFKGALKFLNANIDALYFTNIVNCYASKNINGVVTKTIPSVAERTACKAHLDKIIDIMKPNIIITLGSVASNALSPHKISIMEARGKIFGYKGYAVMPTFHPGFFREVKDKFDEEMIDMYKDNFLDDLYSAFKNALEENPNCGIGELRYPN